MKRQYVSVFFCGTGYNQETKWITFDCECCGASFEAPKIIKETQFELKDAIDNFNKIILTDKKAIRAAKRRKVIR